MAARKINIAVVGAGFMGATHLRVYQQLPRVRIAAICDVSRRIVDGVLRGVAGNIQQVGDLRLGPEVKVLSELAPLLADDSIDAIDVCTPTALHPEQVIASLKAGKHVLCEKPLAQTSADARRILKVAAKSRSLLMPAMCMRFWPGWTWLKEVCQKRTYGKILAAHFRRLSGRPTWGAAGSHPGGALLDMHIHDTDFVCFLFGRPRKVFSTGLRNASGVVDHVVTQYLFDDGPAVSAEGSWLHAGGFNMSYLIHCERATLDFDLQRGPDALRVSEPGRKTRAVKLRGQDGYHGEIRHFVDCIIRHKASDISPAADALATLEVCEAEQKSVSSGAPVKV